MSHIIVCEIGPGALPHLKRLRLDHLRFIARHKDEILFGGPARGLDGTPQTMVIVHKAEQRREVEAFMASEPYAASGRVFASVSIRSWSQVLPEPEPGALAAAIGEEGLAGPR